MGIGLFSSAGRCREGASRTRLGGRDLGHEACACNASYVSVGCCSAPDGILVESEFAKLGEVR